jgi:hypothetical protein
MENPYLQKTKAFFGGVYDYLGTDSLVAQLILTVVIIFVFHLIVSMVESIITSVRNYSRLQATLIADTVTSSDPINTDDKLYPSNNEVNGLEFSFSTHLYIDKENYDMAQADVYRNIFYKGGDAPFPSCAPGVFLHGSQNSLRINMNTIDSIENNIDIDNIPIGKWFHLAIVQKGNVMQVFINGNLSKRHVFAKIPLINYKTVKVFSNKGFTPSNSSGGFTVSNLPMKGMLSRLTYYAYALSFSQIDALMREGPSKKIVSKSYDHTPPYFHDSWWVTKY